MQYDLVIAVTKVHIVKYNVAGQFGVGDGAVRLMGMLPCPHACALFAFLNVALFIFSGADKGYISLIHFRRFVHQPENTVGAC